MSDEQLALIRGTGNAFRDFGDDDADIQQLKAILAAEIIKWLDQEGLSVRKAQALTGIPAADFSRIRNADLDRFTSDRLMGMLNRLGNRVEVSVRVRPAVGAPAPAAAGSIVESPITR